MDNDEIQRRSLSTVYNILAEGAAHLKNVVKEDILHEETVLIARTAHKRIIEMLEAINRDTTSNLVAHARRELQIMGEDEEFIECYLDIIRIFAAQGHSGGSASVFIPTLSKLLQQENLTPITDEQIEWNEVGHGMWQNTRNSRFFSEDGGITYYDVNDKYDEAGAVKLIKPKQVRGK